MRLFLLTTAVVLAASNAFAFKPAVEREFDDIASSGCSNRDGDFIVRGMVSNANENTLQRQRHSACPQHQLCELGRNTRFHFVLS